MKGQKLVITRHTNQKPSVIGIWTFKMKRPIRSDYALSPEVALGCIGGAVRDGMRGCKLIEN